jgi:hypothetical protein
MIGLTERLALESVTEQMIRQESSNLSCNERNSEAKAEQWSNELQVEFAWCCAHVT